jgi:hypothetical protein
LYSKDNEEFGYGFMWWVALDPELEKHGLYMARGVGNQTIAVLPDSDIVIVNRANTFGDERTPMPPLLDLIKQVLNARTGNTADNPDLVTLEENSLAPFQTVSSKEQLEGFAGSWQYPPEALGLEQLTTMDTSVQDGYLLTHSPMQGTFKHFLQEDGTFIEEDSQERYFPIFDSEGEFSGLSDDWMMVNAAINAYINNDPQKVAGLMASVAPYGGAELAVAGMVLAVQESHEAGEQQARKLLETTPAFNIARMAAGFAQDFKAAGKLAEAERIFTLNTMIAPDIARIWEDLGDVQRESGHEEAARN